MPEPSTPYWLTADEVQTIRLFITAADMGATFRPPHERLESLASAFTVELMTREEE